MHGKTFGKNQSRLIDKINSLDYDIIAITGDMGSRHTDDITPLIQLLDGIKNKKYIFYIAGNTGPQYIDSATGEVNEVGQKLLEEGCIFLDKPYCIVRNNDKLYVSDLLISKEKYEEMCPEVKEDNLKIAITHYPMNEPFYSRASEGYENYSLIIAGHYHGGQWRIPFYGAFFVPEVNSGDGVWPDQNEVSGLKQYGEFQQYISRGLGANFKYRFLEFRLFNTPEINLITLVNK